MRPFKPILAGASLSDRVLACIGSAAGIGLTYVACAYLLHDALPLPLLVAPMGASAVLIFAVPASPLAQPWAVVGGNTVSALAGVAAARLVGDPAMAAGLAVGAAILAMSLLRCLHPPGGAAALTAVIGGPAIHSAGFGFALVPVGVNAVVLTLAGWLFHRFSRHSYPHRAAIAGVALSPPPTHHIDLRDIENALAEFGESLDVTPADLQLLLERAEDHAAERQARSLGKR